MRLPDQPPVLQRPLNAEEPLKAWSEDVTRYVMEWARKVIAVVNGGLTMGDGTDIDNLKGKWVDVVTPGAPDTEFTVTHNLGDTPVFYRYRIDKAGTVYDSNVGLWDGETIRLKCSAASAGVKVWIDATR